MIPHCLEHCSDARTEDRNQWQAISINPDILELIYHSHGNRQTRQHYQLSRPGIEVDQATVNYHSPGHQHQGSQPTLIPLLGLQVIILVFLPFHLPVFFPPNFGQPYLFSFALSCPRSGSQRVEMLVSLPPR